MGTNPFEFEQAGAAIGAGSLLIFRTTCARPQSAVCILSIQAVCQFRRQEKLK
jgi:hypothetical protein